MNHRTTTDQWTEAAGGWAFWAARASEYLIPATERLLDLAAVGSGDQTLDLGCGSGEQTIIAARRVGDLGQVTAIDIAAPMIAAAEKNIAASGLRNIATRVSSAEALVGAASPFDAAISRLVLMLIPDPVSAAHAVLNMLRPGGRFAALVPGDQAKTGFNNIALDILSRHGGKIGWDDKPGSIRSLADPARLEAVLTNAGFTDVASSRMATVQRLDSAATMTTVIREGYAFYKSLIADLPPPAQEAAWIDVEQALKRFEGVEGFAGPGEVNLVVGRKPV